MHWMDENFGERETTITMGIERSLVAAQMKRVSNVFNNIGTRVRQMHGARAYDEIVRSATSANTTVRPLPAFTATGALPAGVHDADLGTFLLHVGTNQHRQSLYAPLGERLLQLRDRGVHSVLVGGSGISAKPYPGDVDVLFHLRDARRLRISERLADWAVGTHWHAAERGHWAPQTAWGFTQRPTWMQYFSHYAGKAGSGDIRPQAMVRVVLNDAAEGAARVAARA